MNKRTSRMRSSAAAAALLALSACNKPGVNAGEQGGQAFILMTIMLLLTCAILWFILGREDD